MRKLLSFLAVLIFAFSVSLSAQVSNTASAEFLVKSFESTNLVGESLAITCHWFNPDTMSADDLTITGTVKSVIDSTHITLACAIRYKRWKGSKTLTIRTDSELWLPDSTWNAQIPDSLVSLTLTHTRPLVEGEEFRLRIVEVKPTVNKLGYTKTTATQSSLFNDWD